MAKTIQTNEANVKTTAVEVKVIKISNHQVTQSVFRQLVEEDLIDPLTVQLRGVPWGFVNYFWGNCSNNHLHVIWQKGQELRRACVWRHRQQNFPDLVARETKTIDWRRDRVHSFLELYCCLELLRQRQPPRIEWGDQSTSYYNRRVRIQYKLSHFWWTLEGPGSSTPFAELEPIDASPREKAVYESGKSFYRPETAAEAAKRVAEEAERRARTIQRHVTKLLQKVELDEHAEPQAVWELAQEQEQLLAAEKSAQDRRGREWAQRYDELAALDQLFIAV
jgi:hypothetical protein